MTNKVVLVYHIRTMHGLPKSGSGFLLSRKSGSKGHSYPAATIRALRKPIADGVTRPGKYRKCAVSDGKVVVLGCERLASNNSGKTYFSTNQQAVQCDFSVCVCSTGSKTNLSSKEPRQRLQPFAFREAPKRWVGRCGEEG